MQHVDVFCVQGLQKLLQHTAADIDSKQVAIPKNINIYSVLQLSVMHSGMAIPSNSADSWFIDTQAGISWQQTLSSSLSIIWQWVQSCDMLIRILTLEFLTTMGTWQTELQCSSVHMYS